MTDTTKTTDSTDNSVPTPEQSSEQQAPEQQAALAVPISKEIAIVLNFLAMSHPEMSAGEFAYAFLWKSLAAALSSGYTCKSAKERFGKIYDNFASKGFKSAETRSEFIANRIGSATKCEDLLDACAPEKSL